MPPGDDRRQATYGCSHFNGENPAVKGRTPLNGGGNRLVFAHPDDPSLVIKVIRPDARFENQKNPPWRKRFFRRFKHYNAFVREVGEHIAAHVKNDAPPPFLQRFCGFVETDFGLGSVTKAEREHDGNYAPTLVEIIKRGDFTESVRSDLRDFIRQFLEHDVIAGDFHAGNIVHAWDETHGSHFVIIDGLGEKNVIPLCSLFPWINRHYKLRKIRRMKAEIDLLVKTFARTARAPDGSERNFQL